MNENSTTKGIRFVAPVLRSSRTLSTLRFSVSSAPSGCSLLTSFRWFAKLSIVAFLSFIPALSFADEPDFYHQRYRGWLWFEEKKKDSPALYLKKNGERQNDVITPQAARIEFELDQKELEDLQYVYFARPSLRNQKAYRDKLMEVLNKAQSLQLLWDDQSFLEPKYRDLINEPENVFAVKLGRKIKAEERQKIVKKFADNYELVLFFRKSCPRSSEFEPVLKDFSSMHGIKVEAVSIDGSKSDYFKSTAVITPRRIEQLGITGTPTVIAIRKDGRKAFELIRGFVTLSELEENVYKAWRLIEEQGLKVRNQ